MNNRENFEKRGVVQLRFEGMLTSHYGPRQGIYQPIESFLSNHWRTSLVPSQVKKQPEECDEQTCPYRISNARIRMPPNSFPARSLIKRPLHLVSQAQHSHALSKSSVKGTSSNHTPAHQQSHYRYYHQSEPQSSSKELQTSVAPSAITPAATTSPARSAPCSSAKSSPAHKMVLKKNSTKHSEHSESDSKLSGKSESYLSSLTSTSVVMQPRPSCSNKTSTSLSNTKPPPPCSNPKFAYPDPTKLKGDSLFDARLAELAKLETETIRQEILGGGRWYSISRSTSACSLLSSKNQTRDTRPKSSKSIRQVDRSVSDSVSAKERNQARRLSSSSAQVCRSASDRREFQRPVSTKSGFSDNPAESTSDLVQSMASFYFDETEGVVTSESKLLDDEDEAITTSQESVSSNAQTASDSSRLDCCQSAAEVEASDTKLDCDNSTSVFNSDTSKDVPEDVADAGSSCSKLMTCTSRGEGSRSNAAPEDAVSCGKLVTSTSKGERSKSKDASESMTSCSKLSESTSPVKRGRKTGLTKSRSSCSLKGHRKSKGKTRLRRPKSAKTNRDN